MSLMIVTVDVGPDKSPRTWKLKTMECAIDYFLTHYLDALFIPTNASGGSAFKRVKRRMAFLSKDMAGLILDHKHFDNQLNNKCESIDKKLELRNFE